MFTGLIEARGEVLRLTRHSTGAQLVVGASALGSKVNLGDSVAVNGCCLTAVANTAGDLTFDLLNETLQRTNLGALQPGTAVNLEPALTAHGRLGGHFVQGHIDCTSEVVSFEAHGSDHRLEISLPSAFSQYVAFKGSIAIDGISLTVAEVHPASFVVWIIPHTLAVTNLNGCRAGTVVNLEFDLLAKYVERILAVRAQS